MRFRRPRRTVRGLAVVEITPLIDVVFLLLIFFVVSTTFVRTSALEVDLPDANAPVAVAQPAGIEVRVGADGTYAVNDRLLPGGDPAALPEALRDALRDAAEPDPELVVAADGAARHDAVVKVLDAALEVGLTNARVLTEARGSAPEDEAEDG